MIILQLLLALALLGSSGSSNYATSAQLEMTPLKPQTASPKLVMESGLKPFRAERNYKELDQFEQAATDLSDLLYNSTSTSNPSKAGDTGTFRYGGQVKLLKTIPVNQSIPIGPMTIHFMDVQLLEASDIPENTQKSISILNQEDIGPNMTYMQLRYSIENTTDQNIGFYGLNSVHPNNGSPISADRNFMRSPYVFHQYNGVVVDNFGSGFVYTDDTDKLESIELLFNKIYDYDTGKTIVEPTSLTIPFTVPEQHKKQL